VVYQYQGNLNVQWIYAKEVVMPFSLKEFLKRQSDTKLILTPLIDRFFLTENLWEFTEEEIQLMLRLVRKWQEERLNETYSPSGAKRCLREQAITNYGFKGKQPDDPVLLSIFDDGNWRHLRWHTIFLRMERAGLLHVEAIEQSVNYSAWGLGGTPDDVLSIPTNNGTIKVVVDIKGANDRKWNLIKNTGEPQDGHEYQITCYEQALGLNLGILLYENKNTQNYIEVVLPKNKLIVRELRRRYRILLLNKKARTFPDHECTMKNGDPMFERCWQRVNCVRLTQQGY
jgi:hypothetical protein